MDFISFLILLVISVVISFILHYLLSFYAVPGLQGFLAKVVIGWLGAWLGTPVLGQWFPGVNYSQVYIIPAILGSLAAIYMVAMFVRLCCQGARAGASVGPRPTT